MSFTTIAECPAIGARPILQIQFGPAVDLDQLLPCERIDIASANRQSAHLLLTTIVNPAIDDRGRRELRLRGHADLAHHNEIERRLEDPDHLGCHRHAATRQREHDRSGSSLRREERLAESLPAPSRFSNLPKDHRLGLDESEPVSRLGLTNLVERSRLLEQVRGPRHHQQALTQLSWRSSWIETQARRLLPPTISRVGALTSSRGPADPDDHHAKR